MHTYDDFQRLEKEDAIHNAAVRGTGILVGKGLGKTTKALINNGGPRAVVDIGLKYATKPIEKKYIKK